LKALTFSENRALRRSIRLKDGLSAWESIAKKMKEFGIKVELFGSIARGTPHALSDCDIIVIDKNGHRRGDVLLLAERAAGDFPLDVVFAEDLGAHVLERMREESKSLDGCHV
jgi:predicted nucleotidyltransferase